MELNVAYDVVHANSGRERETQAMQENIAYDVDERSPTQTDEDNEYSTIENIGNVHCRRKILYNSILDNKSNTRQGLAKNECAKKRFAILATTAFVLSLLVAVAALVYTNNYRVEEPDEQYTVHERSTEQPIQSTDSKPTIKLNSVTQYSFKRTFLSS